MKKTKIIAMMMTGALLMPMANVGRTTYAKEVVKTAVTATVENNREFISVKSNAKLVDANGKELSKVSTGDMAVKLETKDGKTLVKLVKTGAEGYLEEGSIMHITDGDVNKIEAKDTHGAIKNVDTLVNVRALPSIKSEIKDVLTNNTGVKILGKTGDWYQVNVGGVKGYIFSNYVEEGATGKVVTTPSKAKTVHKDVVSKPNKGGNVTRPATPKKATAKAHTSSHAVAHKATAPKAEVKHNAVAPKAEVKAPVQKAEAKAEAKTEVKAPAQKTEAKAEVKQQTPAPKTEVKKETPAPKTEAKKEVVTPSQKTEVKAETPAQKTEVKKDEVKPSNPQQKEDKKEVVQEGPKEEIKPTTHEGQKEELLPDVVVKPTNPQKEDTKKDEVKPSTGKEEVKDTSKEDAKKDEVKPSTGKEDSKKDDQKKPVEEAPVQKTEVKHEYNVPVVDFNPGDCLMDQKLTRKLNKKYGGTGFGSYQGKAKDSMGATFTQLLSGNMSLDQAKKLLVGKYVEDGYQIKDIKMITMDIPQEDWAIYGDGSDYIEKHGGMQAFNAEKQTNFYTMWNHNGQDQRHFTRVAFLMDK
ncbi:SH3 domain-containing protein [Clostridium perfringens]|uniref:SH3 domain-containing protein n=1 Tax=Clostridium perfringens TaxID=1502 RepID=UPI0023311314|nr:SH3 domain-containing protein [Clostridium perfringens]MDB2047153.1 SH3 domain-containing protein [Clostridium perfringens]MDB2058797.1 SH3 domain-containing protein [Clostridium perfringens]